MNVYRKTLLSLKKRKEEAYRQQGLVFEEEPKNQTQDKKKITKTNERDLWRKKLGKKTHKGQPLLNNKIEYFLRKKIKK